MELKFFYCPHCGKIIAIVKDAPTPTVCCGEPMKLLVPGITDGAGEKHIPVIAAAKNAVTVTVGEILHPSLPEHYIQWIILKTSTGLHLKKLKPGDKPEARFLLQPEEKIEAAYEYCNLHKLWKSEGNV